MTSLHTSGPSRRTSVSRKYRGYGLIFGLEERSESAGVRDVHADGGA